MLKMENKQQIYFTKCRVRHCDNFLHKNTTMWSSVEWQDRQQADDYVSLKWHNSDASNWANDNLHTVMQALWLLAVQLPCESCTAIGWKVCIVVWKLRCHRPKGLHHDMEVELPLTEMVRTLSSLFSKTGPRVSSSATKFCCTGLFSYLLT